MTKKNSEESLLKANLRKSVYILSSLVLTGTVGLFMAMINFNATYVKNLQALYMMSSEVMQLEKKVSVNNWKLKNYDFLQYKVNAFDNKYPRFSKIVDSVYQKSHEYGFHPDLVLGLMQVESNYDPKAVSMRGAYGLMQVNLAVWRKELGIDEKKVFDVDYNIELGLKILKRYFLESNGNISRALHLYNNGYKYNNTAYIGKVSSRLFNINRNRDEALAAVY